MPTVNYPVSVQYLPTGLQGSLSPALEVELIRGAQRTRAVGVLDSGATITVFNPEHAEMLGIDNLQEGELQHAQTQGDAVEYYLFDLEMQLPIYPRINRFFCRVGFFPVRKPRNILGRNLIFQHYEIGFRDTTGIVHLRAED
jgi:hypothetical protein